MKVCQHGAWKALQEQFNKQKGISPACVSEIGDMLYAIESKLVERRKTTSDFMTLRKDYFGWLTTYLLEAPEELKREMEASTKMLYGSDLAKALVETIIADDVQLPKAQTQAQPKKKVVIQPSKLYPNRNRIIIVDEDSDSADTADNDSERKLAGGGINWKQLWKRRRYIKA